MPRNRLFNLPATMAPAFGSAVANLSNPDFWNEMKSFESQLRRQFNELAQSFDDGGTPVNISRSGDNWLLEWEVAGVSPEDFDIQVLGDQISLSVHRTLPEVVEGERLRYAELASGHMKRSFKLPFEIDRDQLKAEYHNGILSLTLRAVAQDQPQKIEVTAN